MNDFFIYNGIGWICYAEKSQGGLAVPYISTTKSPQQIMGSIAKYYFAQKINKRY